MNPKSLTDEKINNCVRKMLSKKQHILHRVIRLKRFHQTVLVVKYKALIKLKRLSLPTRRKVVKQFFGYYIQKRNYLYK